MKILTVIPTKNRYFSTLPMTLMCVLNQTRRPDGILIIEDGVHENLTKYPLYRYLFSTMECYGICWYVLYGEGRGMVHCHQKSIEHANKNNFNMIWRVDDDDMPSENVLKILSDNARNSENIAACGGRVVRSDMPLLPCPTSILHNKIEEWSLPLSMQWFHHGYNGQSIYSVDHLCGGFLYKVEAALKTSYNLNLSPVGHTEETQFTWGLKRLGYELLFCTEALTWHYKNVEGGIRDASVHNQANFDHDKKIFSDLLEEHKIQLKKYKYFVLFNGLGDHYCFKKIWQKLYDKFKNRYDELIVFCCNPEVFDDLENMKTFPIEMGKMFLDLNNYNVYKWMHEHNWKKRMYEAYLEMYDE